MARARVKKIDNVFWGLASGVQGALAAGGQVAFNFTGVGTQASTLLRMRGEVLVYLDGLAAPGLGCRVVMGAIKVPEGSATTVQYDPASDSNAPWFWYDVAHLGYEEYAADAIDSPVITAARVHVDNKAMRRIRPDEETQIVFSNVTTVGGMPINIAYGIRLLQGF